MESVDEFQIKTKPVFQEIYSKIRGSIFDYFKNSIDVHLLDCNFWFICDWFVLTLVRFEHFGKLQTKKYDRKRYFKTSFTV